MLKLSVFTPTHDPRWLPELYRSLAAQTHPDWEWVIVPNGPKGAAIPALRRQFHAPASHEQSQPFHHFVQGVRGNPRVHEIQNARGPVAWMQAVRVLLDHSPQPVRERGRIAFPV